MDKPVICLFGGAFKPPTRAHFEVVQKAAKICNEVKVIISNQDRGGYNSFISEKVWKQYKKLLPENVTIKVAENNSPVTDIYKEVKNKDNSYLVIFGKGEQDRYNSINEQREKYSNVEVLDIGNIENISATHLREAIAKRDLKEIQKLIPEGIKVKDFLLNFQLHEIKIEKPLSLKVGNRYLLDTSRGTGYISKRRGEYLGKFDNNHHFFQPGLGKLEIPNTEIRKRLVKDITPKEYLPENWKELEESKNLGDLYHFTTIEYAANILKTNNLRASYVPKKEHERDFQSFGRERGERLKQQEGEGAYYISLTRDKQLYKKSPKIAGSSIRFTVDGTKLSSNYKIVPFFYYKDELMGEKDRHRYNENEERIISNVDKNGLKDFKKYLIKTELILDVLEDNQTYINRAKQLKEFYPDLITLYKEKPMSIEQYEQEIVPNIEPYYDEGFLEIVDKTLNEVFTPENHQSILDRAIEWGCNYLQIEKPQINFINDPNYVQQHSSFGGYQPSDKSIVVSVYNRNTADICRSMYHEMIHFKQDIEGRLNLEAGKDGDPYENEANAIAAKMMRKLGREMPEIFEI